MTVDPLLHKQHRACSLMIHGPNIGDNPPIWKVMKHSHSQARYIEVLRSDNVEDVLAVVEENLQDAQEALRAALTSKREDLLLQVAAIQPRL